MEIPHETLIRMYRDMVRSREFCEVCGLKLEENAMPGTVHLGTGQEAVSIGAVAPLRDDDWILPTHRGHGHLIAKGGDPRRILAEFYAKSTGYNAGKGGFHVGGWEVNSLMPNGILGGNFVIGLGMAWALQYQGTDRVAVLFFGDGTANEGTFHEAANMAMLYRVPMVFVCENNLWGEYTHHSEASATEDLVRRAAGYDMPGLIVDGMDVIAVYEAVSEAVARARAGDGPTFIECKTYRFYDHTGRDFRRRGRDPEEEAYWRARDPIPAFRARLIERGDLDEDAARAIEEAARAEMQEAIRFAEESPFPTADDLFTNVYTEARA